MNAQLLNHDFLHEKIPTMLHLYEQEFAEKYEHKNPNASMILNSCCSNMSIDPSKLNGLLEEGGKSEFQTRTHPLQSCKQNLRIKNFLSLYSY